MEWVESASWRIVDIQYGIMKTIMFVLVPEIYSIL